MSRWKSIVNAMSFGVLVIDPDAHIQDINHEGESILGTSRKRILNTSILSFFANQQLLLEQIRQCFATGRSINLDELSQLRTSASKPTPVEVILSYHDEMSAVMVLRDMSKRINIAKNNALLFDYHYVERILSEVAHEINNPLSAILGSARLIQESKDTSVIPLASIISEEALRLEGMLANIRDFARPPRIEYGQVNIHRLLKHLVNRQQPLLVQREIEVREHYDPSLPEIAADEEKLYQVLLNIFKNAVEASSLRSSISITTGVSLGDVPGIGYTTWLIVRIADHGTGVAPDHKEKLFMPFFTTKPQGTGLGLPISMKIVSAHGGKIDVESTVGIGTVVSVFLPLKRRQASAHQEVNYDRGQ
ncbi:two-component system sensor histidine kinase NtrB [Desulfurispira natronophila]|uniref:histidine kinase n=1 Tax=Desulfurispira natronophila TaxID=682562 RepID=A0A7W7Y412_9BACT|nr:ATP-binding protein [Desulfurispira natronophila]MBB5021701.1 PAS domain S-box-containing protein [Desulfurispira natronophila]